MDGVSKREDMKDLICQIQKKIEKHLEIATINILK